MDDRRVAFERRAAPGRKTAWACALSLAALLLLLPTAAQGASRVRLDPPKATAKPTSLVTFKGRAGTKSGGRVAIQRRVGRRWKPIARGRTGARGKFALTWTSPSKKTRVQVRAVLGGSRSKVRRLRVLAPRRGAAKVVVSAKTRVLSASTVRDIPTPGRPGKLVYAGGNDAAVGQIIVIGRGEETPEGFLGRVTAVDREKGQTIVSTVPAKLQQAVPEGSVRLTAATVKAAQAGASPRAARGRVTCTGSVGASIEHGIDFSAGLTFAGSWTLLDGLQSASVTASASLSASIKAALAASGSCSLARTTLLSIKGPSVSGFIGPVPIVMTSNLSVFLDANAQAQASLSTGASAGFDASAGVSWTERGGFQPISSFTRRFSFDPPALSASASVAANVTPTVDVELYGIGGPRVALRTGVELAADKDADPWWSLTVPVDVTASLAIRALGLQSPELHVYQRTFTLADAGGPFGTPAPPPGPPPRPVNTQTPGARLAAGYDQSCGLRPSGTIACWGANGVGQLGTGAPGGSTTPVAVSGVTDAVGVAANQGHTCALRKEGEVACWGHNVAGELGDGTKTLRREHVPVTGLVDATGISAGTDFSCAVRLARRVVCWGANADHQLGDGGTSESLTPNEVTGITNATKVASGTYHSCAVRSTGAVACWGENGEGRLGNGSTAESAVPVAVSGITNATDVALGANHSCALLATRRVVCWGQNGNGQLGRGVGDNSTVPVQVSGITDALQIGAGAGHTCARLLSGTVKCWGFNERGQLGDGSKSSRATPVTVGGLGDVTAVKGGLFHTCALRQSGAMACWGMGFAGQLGNGTTPEEQLTPVAVSNYP